MLQWLHGKQQQQYGLLPPDRVPRGGGGALLEQVPRRHVRVQLDRLRAVPKVGKIPVKKKRWKKMKNEDFWEKTRIREKRKLHQKRSKSLKIDSFLV